MIKQMFKLIWNRKRTNFFLLLEILTTFLVLASVSVFGLTYWYRYSRPLGFSYENVWSISGSEEGVVYGSEERVEILRRIVRALKGFKEVEATGTIQEGFYAQATNYDTYQYKEEFLWSRYTTVTDGCMNVLNVNIVQGRWFNMSDNDADVSPIIINRRFKDVLFGDEKPVGKLLKVHLGGDKVGVVKVVGVVSDFRLYGEYDRLRPFVLRRTTLTNPVNPPTTRLLVRIRPDSRADLKARMIANLQQIAKTWSFGITPVAEIRNSKLKEGLLWFIVLGIVSFFLVVMVALGLTGVLWQNVMRRTREIGLRRANGATVAAVFQQIGGEIFIITTIAVVLGIILILHFLLLDPIEFVRGRTVLLGTVIATVMIYGIAVLCSLYPGYMASRIRPAEALHYY